MEGHESNTPTRVAVRLLKKGAGPLLEQRAGSNRVTAGILRAGGFRRSKALQQIFSPQSALGSWGEMPTAAIVRFLVVPNVRLDRHLGEDVHERELASENSRAGVPRPMARGFLWRCS